MHRLLFYTLLIAAVVLLLALTDYIFYRLLRLLMARQTAVVTNWIVVSVLTLTLGLSAWWGNTRTRLDLHVTHAEVISPRLPSAFDGLRIAQLSDLHLNSFDKAEGRDLLLRMADTLRQVQPDLIVFTGDMVTLRAAEAYPFAAELAELARIPARDGDGLVPVYSVLGNHDYADYVRHFSPERRQQDVDSLISLQEQAGWHMLRNASVIMERDGHQLALVGVENIGEPPFSVYGDLGLAMEEIGGRKAADSQFTVLLSHNPTHWRSEVLPRTAIDLTLSGHTHATQIKVGNWSPAQWKYDEWMGLYTEGDQHLYVNTGVGSVGPRVRIGIEPELSVLTLRRAAASAE